MGQEMMNCGIIPSICISAGEADDYIMRPGTVDAISKGPSQGKARDYARQNIAFQSDGSCLSEWWK